MYPSPGLDTYPSPGVINTSVSKLAGYLTDLVTILEVGMTSHAQIRHIALGCLASFSLFLMFNLCACNFSGNWNFEI